MVNICVTNDHGYVPLVVNTSRSFPRSWLITGCVTRLTRRVSLVEQELPTLPEHLSSPLVFRGVRVTRSLVLYVCFVDCCLSFCTFSFGHCVVCSSYIYGFWLPLWHYLVSSNSSLISLFGCKYCIINLLLSMHATLNNNHHVLMVYWKPEEEEEEEEQEQVETIWYFTVNIGCIRNSTKLSLGSTLSNENVHPWFIFRLCVNWFLHLGCPMI